jgi:hypothetical protein
MTDLENGVLVQHVSLGVGKVVALEANAAHVFFPDGDKRFAAKLRLPVARALLRTDGFERNGWLEGLSAFELDPTTGRYALAASWLTHDQAVDQFLEVFPKGFVDPAYLAAGHGERASVWRAAHQAWVGKPRNGEREPSPSGDDLASLVKRALRVEKVVAPLHPAADRGAVKAAFADEATARAYFTALVELLAVPSPGRNRFEKLYGAAASLPIEPPQRWMIATLFPFVAAPERHILLRPRSTREAAERLGCDLRYDAAPNWVTYSTLRSLATQLLGKLKAIGAKDYVDVESFLHVTATAKRHPARGEEAAVPRRPRGGSREAALRAHSRRSTP